MYLHVPVTTLSFSFSQDKKVTNIKDIVMEFNTNNPNIIFVFTTIKWQCLAFFFFFFFTTFQPLTLNLVKITFYHSCAFKKIY